MLQSLGSQRVGHDWATNTTKHSPHFLIIYLWNYCVCQLEVLGQQADDCIPFPNPAPSDTNWQLEIGHCDRQCLHPGNRPGLQVTAPALPPRQPVVKRLGDPCWLEGRLSVFRYLQRGAACRSISSARWAHTFLRWPKGRPQQT